MNKKILYILYMNSLLPFLSIGNIFSFTGGARKKGTKKKTKRTQRTKKKVVNTKKKNLSRKKNTRRKIISKKRSINKRTRAKVKNNKRTLKKKRQCFCDQKRFYSGSEPSPKGLGYCAHCTPENVTMKGLDGNLWENQKYNKGKRRINI